jgi:hypothetical protein
MFTKLIATAALALTIAVGTATAAPTAQGIKADGLRLQAQAQRYEQARGTTPLGLYAEGLRWQAMARPYLHGLTPAALYADGLRWQAMARAYAPRPVVAAPTSTGSSFDWGAAGIGAAAGIALFAFGAVAIVFVRRSRRTKLAL